MVNIIQLSTRVRVKFTRSGSELAMRTSCTMKQFQTGEFTMAELMELFGKYMYLSGESIFENNEIEVLQ